MKKLIIGLILVMLLMPVACGGPPPPAPAPMPVPTNSESASKVAELEATIRQLEAENQRLLEENQQLSSDLAKVTTHLQAVQSLVSSSSYTNTLNKLTEIQYDASELAAWAYSLPHLPPLPPGLTISEIDQAINKARTVRRIIRDLPSLPPPGWPIFIPFPPELLELERQRQIFLEVTEDMENLHDLPAFLASAGSLEELRSRIETHLADVQSTTSYAEDMMQQIRDATQP